MRPLSPRCCERLRATSGANGLADSLMAAYHDNFHLAQSAADALSGQRCVTTFVRVKKRTLSSPY